MRNEKKKKKKGRIKQRRRPKRKEEGKRRCRKFVLIFRERESVLLLSRFVRDPTVGFLRDKKGNCSTRRGQRIGTGFGSF